MLVRFPIEAEIPVSSIEMLTFDVVLDAVRDAFRGGAHNHAGAFLHLLLETSMSPAVLLVEKFLGHAQHIDREGASTPTKPPLYAFYLSDMLMDRVKRNVRSVYCPPWTRLEGAARALSDYVWRAQVDKDVI